MEINIQKEELKKLFEFIICCELSGYIDKEILVTINKLIVSYMQLQHWDGF